MYKIKKQTEDSIKSRSSTRRMSKIFLLIFAFASFEASKANVVFNNHYHIGKQPPVNSNYAPASVSVQYHRPATPQNGQNHHQLTSQPSINSNLQQNHAQATQNHQKHQNYPQQHQVNGNNVNPQQQHPQHVQQQQSAPQPVHIRDGNISNTIYRDKNGQVFISKTPGVDNREVNING